MNLNQLLSTGSNWRLPMFRYVFQTLRYLRVACTPMVGNERPRVLVDTCQSPRNGLICSGREANLATCPLKNSSVNSKTLIRLVRLRAPSTTRYIHHFYASQYIHKPTFLPATPSWSQRSNLLDHPTTERWNKKPWNHGSVFRGIIPK